MSLFVLRAAMNRTACAVVLLAAACGSGPGGGPALPTPDPQPVTATVTPPAERTLETATFALG
jgi:hypothetical protein